METMDCPTVPKKVKKTPKKEGTMEEFTVEKGFEIPPNYGRKHKYPFESMEVGDSFMFPAELAKNISQAVKVFCKKHPGNKFTVRTRDIAPGQGRVWRTE